MNTNQLNSIDIVSKLQVLGVLVFWQAYDTELAELGEDAPELPYTLAEAIDDYPIDITPSALNALQGLSEIEPGAMLDLSIEICNQVKAQVRAAVR